MNFTGNKSNYTDDKPASLVETRKTDADKEAEKLAKEARIRANNDEWERDMKKRSDEAKRKREEAMEQRQREQEKEQGIYTDPKTGVSFGGRRYKKRKSTRKTRSKYIKSRRR